MDMIRQTMLKISALSLICVFLAGCVDEGMQQLSTVTSSSAGKTDAEIGLEKSARQLNLRSREIVFKNTAQLAAAGAVAGCLFAELSGNDCGRGAVAGGLVGGATGLVAGSAAAQADTDKQQALEATRKLQQDRAQLTAFESQLRKVVASQNAEVASLNRKLKSQEVSEATARSRINAINSNRKALDEALMRTQQGYSDNANKFSNFEKSSGVSLTAARNENTRLQNKVGGLRGLVRQIS